MEKAGVESFMTEGGVVRVSEKMASDNLEDGIIQTLL
jgi:hypothetical protein